MPMITSIVEQETGRPADSSLSPDEAGAHGAAVFANMLNAGTGWFQVANVNAHDLGVMILRNATLPVECKHDLSEQAGSRAVTIPVIEGGDASGSGETRESARVRRRSRTLRELL